MKIFYVKYDKDDQLLNLPNNVNNRLKKLNELKYNNYTHISDKWWTLYSGESLATISDYINEIKECR